MKTFNWYMSHLLGMYVHVEGEDIIKETHPGIMIGNHQHNYDAFTVCKLFITKTVVLAKAELGLIPVFGQIYSLCGNIFIRRGNRKKVQNSIQSIEQKIKDDELSVLIFPEGHRNLKDTLLPFKKGAYFTAVNAQMPLIPFSISQYMKLNNFSKIGKIHIYIKVHPPISTKGKTTGDITELIKESREVIQAGVTEMNEKHLANHSQVKASKLSLS